MKTCTATRNKETIELDFFLSDKHIQSDNSNVIEWSKMDSCKCAATYNGRFRQFIVVIIVNFLTISCGISFGWSSPVIPQLRSNHPPIGDTPFTEDQISWISSLMAIGGLCIMPFCGILSERIGRKKFALLTGLPHITSWLLIIFGQNFTCLCAARFAAGMGAGMTIFIVPLYASEISTEDIRGSLGSLILFSKNVGILFAYIVGVFTCYRLFACLSIIFSLGFVVIFSFMPESPIFLSRQNRPVQARKSLMFLRANNKVFVQQELNKLQSQTKSSNSFSKKIGLKDFFKDRATRKGLIISFGLLGGQQLSGIFAMISYAETIFASADSSISSEIAPIIIGIIQIVGSCISTMLMERAGRRLLTLVSCFGMCISHVFVGVFFCLKQNEYNVGPISWLPVVALSTYIVNYCLGIGPVPFVITSEVFRLNVSSFASTLSYIFYWVMSFISIQAFGMAKKTFGVGGCFFMLASFCAACFIFVYGVMPETKGRDRQDIIDELGGNQLSNEKAYDVEKDDDGKDLMTKRI